MQRAKVTIQARLKAKREERKVFDDLMRRWSSCVRFVYNRLLEGKTRDELKKTLQSKFKLNSRYVDDAILQAQTIITLSKKLGFNPKKVIFGGRELFEKLSKKHLSEEQRTKLKEKWREKRQGNLYSRGDKSKNGNLNLRIIQDNGKWCLRVNVGNRKWVLLEIVTSHKKWNLFESYLAQGCPYSVRIKKRNRKYYCYITFEEELPSIEIGFKNGAIGIDLNAFPSHMAWAEVEKDGNLKSCGEIFTPHLWDGRKQKRDYFAWQYAYQVIDVALEKGKGIVLEKLKIRNKGTRGDFSGGKSRRIRHNFAYKKLKERIICLARRYGIAIRQVSPSYTSVIGMLKYAPQKNLTKDIASAWVIARRGLGFSEKIPKNYKALIGSPKCEPRTEEKETNSRNSSSAEHQQRSLYNLWRVLRAVVLTALSPEKHVPRCFSPLKPLLVSGMWGESLKDTSPCYLGQGLLVGEIPPAGSISNLNWRNTNNPAPKCKNIHFG